MISKCFFIRILHESSIYFFYEKIRLAKMLLLLIEHFSIGKLFICILVMNLLEILISPHDLVVLIQLRV